MDQKNKTKKSPNASPKTSNILDYDPSYETVNQLFSYRIDLLFFLHNLSCMPVIKLDQHDDIHLRELNDQLLGIQLELQSYTMQQYILVTSITKMMEYIISYVSGHSKMSAQEQASVTAFIEMHGGGKMSIARIFIYFVCLCATAMIYTDNSNKHAASAKPTEEYSSLAHSTYNVYDRTIGQTLVEKHKAAPLSAIMDERSQPNAMVKYAKSNPINIKKALEKRTQLTEKKAGLLKTLLNHIIKIMPTASEEIEQYVMDYNKILSNIGEEASDVCNQMMKLAYNNNVFLNFRFMHEVNTIEKKYMQLQEEKKEFIEKQAQTKGKTFLSSLASIVTGDILTPASYIMDIASSWKAVPGNVLSKEDMNAISNIEHFTYDKEEMTTQEKEKIAKYIYGTSSQYCIESFGMELLFKNGNLQLKGDKMNLQKVIDTLETIKYNINAKQMTYEGNAKYEQIYESLKQKFNALIYITDRINNMITFEMFNILKEKVQINVEDPIAGVYKYLDKEADKLNELIKLSKLEFPKDEEAKLEIEKANTAFIKLQNEYKKEEMRINALQSEHIKKEAEMDAELFRARIEAYTNMYLSTPVNAMLRSATSVAAEIIKAPLVEGTYQIYDTIRKIFQEILKDGDATCYLILSGMMLTFVFMISFVVRTIDAFVISPAKNTVSTTVRIVSFPSHVVFSFTKTMFGLLQKGAKVVITKISKKFKTAKKFFAKKLFAKNTKKNAPKQQRHTRAQLLKRSKIPKEKSPHSGNVSPVLPAPQTPPALNEHQASPPPPPPPPMQTFSVNL